MPANKAYIIGLTGGIGCGKSEAAAYLKQLGAGHIDADAISRALTAENGDALPPIRERFGDQVFAPDGTLDRAAMGELVFSSEPHRRALESILHPMIQKKVWEALHCAEEKVVLLDVPLLFESAMDVLCDEVWTVSASKETQICRIMARGLTVEQAKARIASQMSAEEREARSHHVINTDRPIEKTQAELSALYQSVLKKL